MARDRRRGRRRRKGQGPQGARPGGEERPGQEQVGPTQGPPPESRREGQRRRPGGKKAATPRPADVSPLGFWRRSRVRSYREQPLPKLTFGRLWRRFSGFYFPPWVPVALVIVAVFGILFGVFFIRQAGAGAPHIGQDHWHARYEVFICGNQQPVIPPFAGGVHTHGDGIVHIHPHVPAEEGRGARLVKFFEYAGGRLSNDTLQMPGDRQYQNGDLCEGGQFDGQPGVLQIYVNGQRLQDVGDYLPQDGDSIRIVFAPEGQLPPGTVATPTPAAETTVNVVASDRGSPDADSFFEPNEFTISAGVPVRVVVANTGSISHNLRVAGADNQYGTADDQFTGIIVPGEEGELTVQIDQPGTYNFRCDIHPNVHFGTLTVTGDASPTPEATP